MREKGDGGGGVLEAHAIFFAKQAGDFFGVVATFALDFIDSVSYSHLTLPVN